MTVKDWFLELILLVGFVDGRRITRQSDGVGGGDCR